MSRIAIKPIMIPAGVEINCNDREMIVKGANGQLTHSVHPLVDIEITSDKIQVKWNAADKNATALAGTTRAVVYNLVAGVSKGFEKKLTLIGVGYRAQVKGNLLNLTLGFSHPVDFEIPAGINIETPSQTEIIVKGSDKQQVGAVAAKIRAYRPPEPYKGKGVGYHDEHVARKEAKKK